MGFPTRPSRAAFGPRTLKDRKTVVDNSKEIGATTFELMFWQLAGLGIASSLAWVLFHWNGVDVVIDASAESWDPYSVYVPDVTRTSAGVYVVTYAATFQDERGTTVATALKSCEVIAQGSTIAPGVGAITSSRIVTTTIKKMSDGSAYDPAGVLVRVG
jgi:hypothetical protein